MKKIIVAAGVILLALTGCSGVTPPPEPTLTDTCEDSILSDNVTKNAYVYGGKGGYTSVNITVRLCVTDDGKVTDLEVE